MQVCSVLVADQSGTCFAGCSAATFLRPPREGTQPPEAAPAGPTSVHDGPTQHDNSESETLSEAPAAAGSPESSVAKESKATNGASAAAATTASAALHHESERESELSHPVEDERGQEDEQQQQQQPPASGGVPVAQALVDQIAALEHKSERSLMHRYNNGAVRYIVLYTLLRHRHVQAHHAAIGKRTIEFILLDLA